MTLYKMIYLVLIMRVKSIELEIDMEYIKVKTLYISGMGAPNRAFKDESYTLLAHTPHMFRDVSVVDEKINEEFIKEVIIHELLHLRYPNHNKIFKVLLKKYLKSGGSN